MISNHPNLSRAYIALSLLLFVSFSSVSQENLIFKVKLTDSYAQKLETSKKSLSKSGYVTFGLKELDQINETYHAVKMERVFPYSKKYDIRHRKHGLHLWYKIVLDSTSYSLEQCRSTYEKCEFISLAETYLPKKINDGYYRKSETIKKQTSASLQATTNDPRFNDQWHYDNTGQTGGIVGSDIDLLRAWDIEAGRPNVIVAVIDEGIDVDHEDLADNMWVNSVEASGLPGVDDDNNGYIDDIHGYGFGDNTGSIPAGSHGTHVGGTVAAVNNNSIGVSGVAGGTGAGDGIRLMSCAAFGQFGTGGFDAALVYAADNGAVIAQNSWGYRSPGFFEQSVLDAIDYFISNAGHDELGEPNGPLRGGAVIFASGNDNSSQDYYPGFYPSTYAVASTDHSDIKSSFSNYGTWVDISAPGSEILSTFPGNTYGSISGTSMACPHVSGVAALLVSRFNGISSDEMLSMLTNSVDSINDINPSYAGLLGAGRLNAFQALQLNDSTPPSRIEDLVISNFGPGTLELAWSAPGGNDNSVKASSYEIRYSTSEMDSTNFSLGTLVSNDLRPADYGSAETFEIMGLSPLTRKIHESQLLPTLMYILGSSCLSIEVLVLSL